MARCDSYDPGECTRGACHLEDWVPDDLGNAVQWLGRAQARGLTISDVPTLDAIACFTDAHLYDPTFGHVAVVTYVWSYSDFQVREMNYARWNAYDLRRCTRAGLLGFIIPPGAAIGDTGPGLPVLSAPQVQGTVSLYWSNLARVYDQELPAIIARHYAVRDKADALTRT